MQRLMFKLLIFGIALVVGGFRESATYAAGVESSKINAYTVVSPPTGEVVSKANAYTVVSPPISELVSKVNAYTVVAPKTGVLASKTVAYVVVAPPPPGQSQPSIFITTQNDRVPSKALACPLMN